ncbi:nuclear factor 7, ovary-like [Salarias fasciatus]|uniref:nuclear factor 7, ovary-like n=1 Tax=Salarias fasciatus TaxID=181472 RepID=UPI001176AC29|nr:nuclear factor 7, ovary-like [Salarias fasciatus]
MASSLLAEDLTCSVCLSVFTDPVTLQCGHSFCRRCAGEVLAVQPRCPQCCRAVVTEAQDLPSSLILKSLAEKARGARGLQAADLCPEHEEKLKLFCITDQQLTYIICRDAERHEGHTFKPIKEADAALRKELETFLQNVSGDISAVEGLADRQREEISKSRKKSENLMTQISNQFREMHQFLTRREKQIENELKQKQEDEMKRMDESLRAVETVLCERKELEVKVNSALEIKDSESFLKSWTEDKNRKTTGDLFRPRAEELRVENTSFSLWPYESHLQFFVWKEMLEIIQPRAERLSLSNNSRQTVISNSGRSLIWDHAKDRSESAQSLQNAKYNARYSNNYSSYYEQSYGSCNYVAPAISGQAFSSSEFTSGQHYWEVDVGSADCWKLGIKNYYLDYDGQRYAVCDPSLTRNITISNTPQKFGFYLNCSSQQLSFYDADSMTHIDTVDLMSSSVPTSAYFHFQDRDANHGPLTVCWY